MVGFLYLALRANEFFAIVTLSFGDLIGMVFTDSFHQIENPGLISGKICFLTTPLSTGGYCISFFYKNQEKKSLSLGYDATISKLSIPVDNYNC